MKFLLLLSAPVTAADSTFSCGAIALVIMVAALVFIDHRLHKLVKIQQEMLKEMRDLAARMAVSQQSDTDRTKALQWMIDNWPR